jgi:hypothetical protein
VLERHSRHAELRLDRGHQGANLAEFASREYANLNGSSGDLSPPVRDLAKLASARELEQSGFCSGFKVAVFVVALRLILEVQRVTLLCHFGAQLDIWCTSSVCVNCCLRVGSPWMISLRYQNASA